MAEISLAEIKSIAAETSDWIWGTAQGAFNERQTTSQIIVDAVIGMIPLVGDATAVRDLIAVTIRLCNEPQRREQVFEWVLLVILLFALIPVAGGVIKGVGRLALKVGKNAAENSKVLTETIQFLNRMGRGNAVKWLKQLDVLKYQNELIGKFTDFCTSIADTISEVLKSRIGQLLSGDMRTKLQRVQTGLLTLRDLGGKMIPQALKELNAKLKVLQELVYQGEVHTLATGQKNLTREAEALMLRNEVRAAIKAGKWPQNLLSGKLTDPDVQKQLADWFDRSKIAEGWPDLLRKQVELPGHGKTKYYNSLCTFSGKIAAWGPEQFAGQTIYRAFGPGGKLAGPSNAGGYFWGAGAIPQNAKAWREMAAVLDEWNANGLIVLVTFPPLARIQHEPELMQALKGWHGSIAEQFGDKIKNQFLAGGGKQVGMNDLPATLATKITELGEAAKAGKLGSGEVMGVRIEVRKTSWTEVEGKYGYAEGGEDLSRHAITRQLETDEIKSKVSNSAPVAAARAGNQGKQKETAR
ncbi:hypothetical protein ACFOLG_02725 [Vogesella facilis]|uniref:Uncharacterized protein n=1 Tax=Vogesella facilis TaxID=1655232 RepID=A0ABV7RBD9_9NEIS